MTKKGIGRGICHAIHRYAKANNKNMKDYDKNKGSWYLKSWDVNNLCRWTISQTLLLNDFRWVEDISEFNENFIKSYNDDINEG